MGRRASTNSRVVVADALHSAAIHLLRGVRKEDVQTGVGPARLSALSVLVFAGPMRLTDLARIEQVKPPTMTKVRSEERRVGKECRSRWSAYQEKEKKVERE